MLGWIEGTVTISVVDGVTLLPDKDQKAGWVSYPFGAHQEPIEDITEDPLWTLTHLPTGQRICQAKSLEACNDIMLRLLEVTPGGRATWAHPDPTQVQEKLREPAVKVLKTTTGRVMAHEESMDLARKKLEDARS